MKLGNFYPKVRPIMFPLTSAIRADDDRPFKAAILDFIDFVLDLRKPQELA